MPSVTVRISEKSWKTLCELAEKSGESPEAVLERAIEEYRRERFMEAANAAYAALRADPEAWAEYQKELALWDCTLMDGLDPNEIWHPDGTVTYRGTVDTTDVGPQ
jgi:predicted transcriptional regulator